MSNEPRVPKRATHRALLESPHRVSRIAYRAYREIQCFLVNVSVSRSPFLLLSLALLAVPAVVLAVDMTISYRFIDFPETRDVTVGQTTDENGQLVDMVEQVYTDTGRAQRRRDVVFGAALFLGGASALGWSLLQLAKPGHFLSVEDDALWVNIDGPRHSKRRLAWEEIAEVRSGVIEDDGVDTPVLSIRLENPDWLIQHPSGGLADPPWLHLYSDDWDTPAHQVAALIEIQISGRDGSAREYGDS